MTVKEGKQLIEILRKEINEGENVEFNKLGLILNKKYS